VVYLKYEYSEGFGMNELEKAILKVVKENKSEIKFKILAKKLRIFSEKDKENLRKKLNNLEAAKKIIYDPKKGLIGMMPIVQRYKGIIKIDKTSKNGLLISAGKVFIIKNENLNGALNGDCVYIETTGEFYNNRALAIVDTIVSRKDNYVNCEYENNKFFSVDNSNQEVKLPKAILKDCNDGDIIKVKIDQAKSISLKCDEDDVEKILDGNDKYYLQKKTALSYGFPLDFSKGAMEEADNLPVTITEDEIKKRLDLRNLPIITIDCDSTKDMDDAVYAEKLPNGNYKLYVSIAHVNHYINPETAPILDKEANMRGCSVYLDPTVFPMLPARISNGICSLNPDEDKLTLTTIVEIDKNGTIVDGGIYHTVIKSRAKMKYSVVNEYLNDPESVPMYQNELGDQLVLLQNLSEIMGKNLERNGKKEFVNNEIEVNIDENNNPINFASRKDGAAQKIIENCMIYSNIYVATTFLELNEPCIYRIHELPNEEKLIEIANEIKSNNCISMIQGELQIDNLELFLKRLTKKGNLTNQIIISNLLLRCMARAKYSTNNCGHYGLGLETYCHSTSPIRRYSDLIIQRLIDTRIAKNNSQIKENNSELEELTSQLDNICATINEREIAEDQAEKELLKIQMIQFMSQHIGETFAATISNIGPTRIDLILDNNIIGIASLNDIMSGSFKYNPQKNIIIDAFTGKKLSIGNKVFVHVNSAGKNGTLEFIVEDREKDFALTSEKGLSRTRSLNYSKSF
jgi:ribonuclease R